MTAPTFSVRFSRCWLAFNVYGSLLLSSDAVQTKSQFCAIRGNSVKNIVSILSDGCQGDSLKRVLSDANKNLLLGRKSQLRIKPIVSVL